MYDATAATAPNWRATCRYRHELRSPKGLMQVPSPVAGEPPLARLIIKRSPASHLAIIDTHYAGSVPMQAPPIVRSDRLHRPHNPHKGVTIVTASASRPAQA